jgi:hypothetical protein
MGYYSHPHFSEEKTEFQRLSDLPEATQLGFEPRLSWTQGLYMFCCDQPRGEEEPHSGLPGKAYLQTMQFWGAGCQIAVVRGLREWPWRTVFPSVGKMG